MQKIINTNSFHGYVQEDVISYGKYINTKSFHGYIQEYIISYRKEIISYRNVLFVWFCPKKILSQTEINCFHGIVKRRYYLIQKNIDTNSFHGHVQEDIISYRNL